MIVVSSPSGRSVRDDAAFPSDNRLKKSKVPQSIHFFGSFAVLAVIGHLGRDILGVGVLAKFPSASANRTVGRHDRKRNE